MKTEDEMKVPLKHRTLSAAIVDQLRQSILDGTYPAGSQLRQDALGEAYGVSRIPVREALRQLEAEGLVTFNPHRGAVVSVLSLKQIRELFELRAEIEGDLIRRAVPLMKPEDHAKASEILDAYDLALRSGQVAAWGGLNWQFHSTLYAPADRELTMTIVGNLHDHSDRYLRMQLALTHGETRARHEHRAIAAAARKGDSAGASRLMRNHILGAGRTLVTFLERERAQRGKAAETTSRRRSATSSRG